MGTFNNKIVAEFTPPKTWVLEEDLSFETDTINNDDILLLEQITANIEDTGKGSGKITAKKGMKTDLASVPRICWVVISPWDVARAAVIHDHLYERLREFYNLGDEPARKAEWKKARKLSDKIFLLGMKSADPKIPSWKIYPAYWSVRLFGRWPASAKRQVKYLSGDK